MMEERQFEMKVIIPIIIVFWAICLGIVNWYKSEISTLKENFRQQSIELDSLEAKNKELTIENEKLKNDTCQHIMLDVAGVMYNGDGEVVYNRKRK